MFAVVQTTHSVAGSLDEELGIPTSVHFQLFFNRGVTERSDGEPGFACIKYARFSLPPYTEKSDHA